MFIRMSTKNSEEGKQTILPNVAAVIEFIKMRRKTTREKAVNLEREQSIPSEFEKQFLRQEDTNRVKFNPASADLKLLYPEGTGDAPSSEYSSVNATVNANFNKDKG